MKQCIRYVRTSDGVSLAWAEAGQGLALVKAANWLTHLDFDWESPVWRHWNQFLAGNFRFVRHDERGCGMTDWTVGDLSFPRWIEDLEQVVDAARVTQPFVLLGISQGAATAAAYAARHPERVSHLILYGGYALGTYHRGDVDAVESYKAVTELVRLGWGQDNPVFRQLFTARFIPDGNTEQLEWFNELCRRTTTPEIGAELMTARGHVDASAVLAQVKCPTLVLHAGDDQVIPLAEGKRLARDIPDASFVQLDSRNHVLLEHEPAWQHFQQAVLEFTGQTSRDAVPDTRLLQSLTRREHEMLDLLCEGHSNAQIGWALGIAEKTARNHLSNLYRKLQVRSRAAAIVFAYENKLPHASRRT